MITNLILRKLVLVSLTLIPRVQGFITSCLPPPTISTPCTRISSWNHLITVVKTYNSTDALILCPFSVTQMDNSTTLEITKSISILCRDSRKCKLNSSANGGKSIVRAKGPSARVLFQGFTFTGAAKNSPAVQVANGTSLVQSFCDCTFQGNIGLARGIALLAEIGTNVFVENCLFQNNTPYDMGTVFNRGSMIISSSMFQHNNGTGGALASSRGSNTTLLNNTFLANYNGVPVLFQDTNYVDAGGNEASLNALCNGIFARNKCINLTAVEAHRTLAPIAPTASPTSSRPTIYPTAHPSTTPTIYPTAHPSPFRASCEEVNAANQTCVNVVNWADFRQKVNEGSGTVVFCPFNITKGRQQPVIYITSSIRLVCTQPKQCRINAGSRHIMVNGWLGAQLYVQGFVFQGATNSSMTFIKNNYNNKPQTLCNCAFVGNKSTRRGSALWIEEGNNVTVSNCLFTGNEGMNNGGAIFNGGQLNLVESRFSGNFGPGSALASTLGSHVNMIANTFTSNQGRNPIYFQGLNFTDLGGNTAFSNGGCNGIFIVEDIARCESFSPLRVQVTSAPSSPPAYSVSTRFPTMAIQSSNQTTPRGGPGYFNYDQSDYLYGPMYGGWKNVTGNPEYLRWAALSDQHNRSLINKCDNSYGQSPIDLCENYLNAECMEHHQARSYSGNVSFGLQVTPQILPSMLRLLYYPNRTPEGGPYPPAADFAENWNGNMDVNNIDVKIPSEHTICGKRFPAEYSIYMLHPLRRHTMVMSILMDFDPDDKDNDHFQVAIDEWQAVYDTTASTCEGNISRTQEGSFSRRSLRTDVSSSDKTVEYNRDKPNRLQESKVNQRTLAENMNLGIGGWDPFHPSLKSSIYHWGYWGSLTEPPCSTFFSYRVVSTPAYISRRQWNQMRNILFNYKDENCTKTSVDYNGSVARPIQPLADRPLYKCTRSNYVSDAEKAEIRLDTGNPTWCC